MADLTRIAASNGSGEAVRALVTANRSIGSAVIKHDAHTNWSTNFIGTTGSLDTNGRLTTASMQVFNGHLSGTDVIIDSFAPGYTDKGNVTGDVIIIKPTTLWADNVSAAVNGLADGSAVLPTANIALNNLTVNGNLTLNGGNADDWRPFPGSITTVTSNGNRSYTLTTSADNTSVVSPGYRIRTTRTVAAPTQSASLNGTTQYFNRTGTITGMANTNNFVGGAYVKLTSYTFSTIISRYNGTSGWTLDVNALGQIEFVGFNGGSANNFVVRSNQSIPLNKWVHVTAQMDMSVTTNSAITNYIMIDGVDVPAIPVRGGTGPVTFVQAGNLEVGSRNGGTQPFVGKIAQPFVTNAKVTQTNVRTLISQGLTPALISANNIISAYSLSNSLTDLNTTNANNLTAQGSATTTNADAPFGGQANGTISATLDYGIVSAITSSTVTVQVPEGGAIPTSGGITAVAYSAVRTPFGFPGSEDRWTIQSLWGISISQSSPTNNVWYNIAGVQLLLPVGGWFLKGEGPATGVRSSASNNRFFTGLSSSATTSTDSDLVMFGGSDAGTVSLPINVSKAVALASVTPYYWVFMSLATHLSLFIDGSNISFNVISAKNSYL